MGSQVHSIVSHTRRFHHIKRESRLQRGVNPKLEVPSIWIILSIWFYVHNKLFFLPLLCSQELGLVNTLLLLDRLLCTFIILKLDNLLKIMLFLYFLQSNSLSSLSFMHRSHSNFNLSRMLMLVVVLTYGKIMLGRWPGRLHIHMWRARLTRLHHILLLFLLVYIFVSNYHKPILSKKKTIIKSYWN